VKYWRGDYVIVFPGRKWKFHTCVVCGRKLKFGTASSETGIGPECAKKPTQEVEAAKAAALEGDRRRYRAEIVDLGFTIEH